MKTLIGYAMHTPETTGVRPRQQRVFLSTPVHIPPPRRRPMDECRAMPRPEPVPSTLSQHVAFLAVAWVIALGTAVLVWW